MRNKYPGTCYRCHQPVAVGAGHFERFNGGWRTQHASCAIICRGTTGPMPVPETEADIMRRLEARAARTGKHAQIARRMLREMGALPPLPAPPAAAQGDEG